MDAKIKKVPALSKILSGLRRKKRTVVFTNGCFDVIHAGHVTYLKKAKAMGDVLVVGLNSDSSVRRLKGDSRPINKAADRAGVLSALSAVDYITIFDEDTPETLIRAVKPDILVKGGDWKITGIAGSSYVQSYGGRVRRVPFVIGYSTTALIKNISRHE